MKLMILLGSLALGGAAYAQGCNQCRENVAQTAPATRRAYRHGIEVLALAAGCVCGSTLMVARRFGR
jgi:hypothetical protein